MRNKKFISAALLTLIMILTSVNVFASGDYALTGLKQAYYYDSVVPYINNTGDFSSALQTAFSVALNDWNYNLSKFEWGSVSEIPSGCSDNELNIFSSADNTLYGRCQYAGYIGGNYTSAWAELNQYALETYRTTSANFKRSVAGHELGHAICLDDYNSVTTVLMSHIRNRDTLYTPQMYDIYGVNQVY